MGLWRGRRAKSWRETLLLAWIFAPVAFFQVWPVKGYQYLLPAAPPLTLLAARGLNGLGPKLRPLPIAVVARTLMVPTWRHVRAAHGTSSLAGTGRMDGGRDYVPGV